MNKRGSMHTFYTNMTNELVKRWSHEGYDRLRRVATSCRNWTQKSRTSCIFGHTVRHLRLIYHLSQVNVRHPCDGRNWSYKYLLLTASYRKNVCHRPQVTRDHLRRICGICVITHVQYRTFLQSLASIAWTSCVYHPVVPNVLYCFFMPPQTKSGGGIMRCTCPSVRPSVPRIGFRTITSKSWTDFWYFRYVGRWH